VREETGRERAEGERGFMRNTSAGAKYQHPVLIFIFYFFIIFFLFSFLLLMVSCDINICDMNMRHFLNGKP
jgi:hypothetical protein